MKLLLILILFDADEDKLLLQVSKYALGCISHIEAIVKERLLKLNVYFNKDEFELIL